MQRFTSMVIKRAKTPKETKSLMTELDARAKRVLEVTGIQAESGHEMSVITGIIDVETLKHTAQWQRPGGDVKELKRKIMEFANLMAGGTGGGDAMEIGRVERKVEEDEDYEEDYGQGGEYYEGINGVGEVCYKCGGKGHYARECPNKGEGKGKGKGKGKSWGKGGDGASDVRLLLELWGQSLLQILPI